MVDLLNYSKEIRNEADDILHKAGLLALLQKYGNVKFTGSYELDLMIKKDIDITIITQKLSLQNFYQMGGEISALLLPHSMFFRNTKVKRINKRPNNGYYWGVQFADWKLDIWALDENVYGGSVRYLDSLLEKITDENKLIILNLKYHFMEDKAYGIKFNSKDIYDAVLNCGVKTGEEFIDYLIKKGDKP
jgi:hypothetical protein